MIYFKGHLSSLVLLQADDLSYIIITDDDVYIAEAVCVYIIVANAESFCFVLWCNSYPTPSQLFLNMDVFCTFLCFPL
jgi:hypothetical protein